LGPLESVAVSGLTGKFRQAYNTDILQVWYLSIDMPSILLHMEFEDGLSISVLKNRATCHKNLQLGIEKFLRVKDRWPILFHTPPFWKSRWWSRLGAPMHVKASRMIGTYSKE
jgi:hypothetical protein